MTRGRGPTVDASVGTELRAAAGPERGFEPAPTAGGAAARPTEPRERGPAPGGDRASVEEAGRGRLARSRPARSSAPSPSSGSRRRCVPWRRHGLGRDFALAATSPSPLDRPGRLALIAAPRRAPLARAVPASREADAGRGRHADLAGGKAPATVAVFTAVAVALAWRSRWRPPAATCPAPAASARSTARAVVVTKYYDYTGFTKVTVDSGFDVEIDYADDDSYAVSVTVDDNLVEEHLKVELDGDTLHVGLAPSGTYHDVTLTARWGCRASRGWRFGRIVGLVRDWSGDL